MANNDVWIYRSGMETTTEPVNLIGYDVEATDGSLGKVDEATTQTGHQSVRRRGHRIAVGSELDTARRRDRHRALADRLRPTAG
jgi:hypothetical protein